MKQFFSQIGEEIPIPSNVTLKAGNYYMWGTDNYYTYKLYEAYLNSATHQALVKTKVQYILGQGVSVENPDNLAEYIRFGNQDLNSLVNKIAFDYVLYGGFAFKITKSLDGSLKHIRSLDFSGVRYSTDINEDGESNSIIFSRDWRNTYLKENRKIVYSLDKNEDIYSFVYTNDTRCGERYPHPDYEAGLISILTEYDIDLFTKRNMENNFSPTLLITFTQDLDEETYDLAKTQLQKQFKGANKAGGVMMMSAPNKDTAPIVQPIEPNLNNNVYIEQSRSVIEKILISHQVSQPSIAGVQVQNAFSNGNELEISYKLFDRTTINGLRNVIENALNTVFEDSGWNIGKITLTPINFNLLEENNNSQAQNVQQ